MSAVTSKKPTAKSSSTPNWTFYLWIGLALAVACAAVILGWHSGDGTTDHGSRQ